MTELVGQNLSRVEDARFLTGKGNYVDDIHIDKMAHVAIFRSPTAHARIRSIDASKAIALPGVVKVLTYADIAAIAKPIPTRIGGMPGFDEFLQLPLAGDKVRYVGEPIAVVIAEDPYLAEDGVELISVEFEDLPRVFDWHSSKASGVLIHERAGTNVSAYSVERGHTDEAFARASYVRAENFRIQRHTAVPLETRGLIAVWNARDKHLRLLGATKIPFFNRRVLAKMLELPESAVDLIVTDVGGSFGVRGEFYPEDFLVPYIAMTLERPIKWVEDRREHLMASNHSREVECELEIACDQDGTILGLRGNVKVDIGAYARGTGGTVPTRAAQFLPGPYRIPNFSCEVTAFVTNKTPAGTYRGPGRYEANFFRERLIDIAAADLGLDPCEMRRRNLVSAAEMPYPIGKLVTYEPPTEYDSGNFHVPFERALAEIGWHERKECQGKIIDGWYYGIGIACFVESGAGGRTEDARISLAQDGKLDVYVGTTNNGQGHETVLAQICGDAAGIGIDQIRIHSASTDQLGDGVGSWHSRTVVMGGNAIVDATRNFLKRLEPLAAAYFGDRNMEVHWRAGKFHGNAGASQGRAEVTLREIAQYASTIGERAEGFGKFDNMGKKPFSYGTHAAYVAVNPRTGRVRVIDYVAVEDVGRVINPALAHGQAIGGVVQGLGGAFLEHLIYDDEAQLLTGSLADYLLPTALDFPNVRGVLLEEAPAPGNPLGAKGVGEGGIVAVGAAIGNAVSAALAPLKVQVRDLPLSAPRVWQIMNYPHSAPRVETAK